MALEHLSANSDILVAMKIDLPIKNSARQLIKLFSSIPLLFVGFMYPQTDTLNQSGQNSTIRFSTITNTRQKSLEPYYRALKDAKFGEQRFSVFEQLAAHHIDKGNSDSIVHYGNLYLRELQTWDKRAEEKSLYTTRAHYILGLGSKLNGLLDNAIKWHIKGIAEAEAATSTEYRFKHKIGLSNIYNLKTEYQKAISILKKTIADFEKDWPELTPEAYVALGDAYFGLKEDTKAKTFYTRALEGLKKSDDLKLELGTKLKLGTLAVLEDRYDDAFALLEEAKETGLENGYNTIYFQGTIRLGKLFYQQKEYESAMMALSVAYVNAIERENLFYQKEILDIHRKIFAATDDHKNAYAVMTQLAWVNEQMARQQQQSMVKELEIQYETLEKEKAISTLEEDQILKAAELERQKTIKNAFLIGFLIILMPILALLYVYYQKMQAQSQLAKKQEEINEQRVSALKQEQELNLIKASIEGQDEERKRIAQELHDSIGGNLAGIKLQMASLNGDSIKYMNITKQLDETYQLVRDISHTLIPKKFKQNAFTELIGEYIKSISDTGELKVGFHPHPIETINTIDEKIQIELFKVIQELMTNTLKHADAKKLDIHLNLIDDELSLLFEDDGKGFDAGNGNHGIGLKNVKNRISELSGSFHIDSAGNRGTVVSIEIPIKKEKNEI